MATPGTIVYMIEGLDSATGEWVNVDKRYIFYSEEEAEDMIMKSQTLAISMLEAMGEPPVSVPTRIVRYVIAPLGDE